MLFLLYWVYYFIILHFTHDSEPTPNLYSIKFDEMKHPLTVRVFSNLSCREISLFSKHALAVISSFGFRINTYMPFAYQSIKDVPVPRGYAGNIPSEDELFEFMNRLFHAATVRHHARVIKKRRFTLASF